ncbi:peptide chain release factor H [Tenacibaculum sp. TC6]|uniref:peptide chain release factor H n=1 Tax=Tenacibaculum sp. TC6 TaxID=3423223 RepID=UPI003D363826
MDTKLIQFTAAKGPAECAWVVAKVLKIFIQEVQKQQCLYEIVQKENGTENGTVQSVLIRLEGLKLETFLQNWLGTIQWLGTSTFRKYHKRKNWFIGCFEITDVKEQKLKEADIEFQAIRSSGPGGQHVNKVSSAIRAKHIPTRIQVLVSESRSQHQNKKIAVERLKEKIAEQYLEQLKNTEKTHWENHLSLQRGNPVRIFEGTDFKQQKENKSYKTKRNQLKNDLRKQLD